MTVALGARPDGDYAIRADGTTTTYNLDPFAFGFSPWLSDQELVEALTEQHQRVVGALGAGLVIAHADKPDTVAVAHLLAAEWEGIHAYVPGRGWHHRRRDRLWTRDEEALVLRKQISNAVAGADNIRSARTRNIVAELEPLLIRPGAWDANPTLCGLPDGRVLDLATGHTRDATEHDLITRRLGAHPRESATCPRWLELVDHICPDPEERAWFQAWCGYTLTGHTREHLFVFMAGPGGGGKSTATETIRRVLGTYAVGIPEDVFVGGANRHREWLARLAGARLAAVPDLPAGGWSNMAILKSLVSAEPQTANFMRSASFEFTPAAKVWLTGNSKPRLARADSGFARRLVIMPVDRAPHQDRHLGQALRKELPAIAAWCTEGATTYLAHGLPPVPERWTAAADAYHRAEDTIGAWFNARCQLDPTAFTPARDLVGDYNAHTGGRMSRATPLYDWLLDTRPEGVTRARVRHADTPNPVDGLRGVRLCA